MGETPGLDQFGRFTSRAELSALRPKLQQGEVVRYAVAAVGDRRGLLAATDRRVLWLSQGTLQVRTASYAYGEIRRLVVEVDRDGATITLHCPDGEHRFTQADRTLARAFAEQVRTVPRLAEFRRVELLDEPEEAPAPKSSLDERTQERLQALTRMREKGSLTEAEFRANRRRILEAVEATLPSHQRPFARKVEL